MTDIFEGRNVALSDPAGSLNAITPNDAEDLQIASRAIYVGGAGDIALHTINGNEAVLKAVPAGAVLPIRAARILSTGTTATDLVALW